MTQSEVQAAQPPSVAVIVFAFIVVILVCAGGGRAAKASSDGRPWNLGGRDRCRRRRRRRRQRHRATSPRTGHGPTFVVVISVATSDGERPRRQRKRRTTRCIPRQPPQDRIGRFGSHLGVVDVDVVHDDGAPDRGEGIHPSGVQCVVIVFNAATVVGWMDV